MIAEALLALKLLTVPQRVVMPNGVVGIHFKVPDAVQWVSVVSDGGSGMYNTSFFCTKKNQEQDCKIGLYMPPAHLHSWINVSACDLYTCGQQTQEVQLSCISNGGTGCPEWLYKNE